MVTGLIGRKVGMTQVFETDGTVVPVTVIKAGPCVVVQAKTAQTDGYEAVQIGLVADKPAKVNKPTAGHYKKANVPPTQIRREVKVAPGGEALKPGDQVLADIFKVGERVDVIGTSRGKGFQGVMKRHHFAGGAATHGSMFHRAPGRMGADRITTHNLRVVGVDLENHLVSLRGAVPGAPDGIVIIRKAVAAKRIAAPQPEKKKGKK